MTSVIFMHCAEKFILVLHKLHFFFVILSLSVFTKQLLCAISLLKSFFYLLLTLLKDTFYSLLAPTPTNTFNVFALLEVCLEKTWVGYAITENLLH